MVIATNLAHKLFEGADPPPRDDLLSQGFTRGLAMTKRALADEARWPQELDEVPISNSRFRIDRRLLFLIADRRLVHQKTRLLRDSFTPR